MKNTEIIQDKIKIDEFLNSNNNFNKFKEYFKEYYENFNKVKSVMAGQVYCKYKINFEFIDKIFYVLNNECSTEEDFKDIESKLILFRDLLFYFKCFKKDRDSSVFNFITPTMLNFKYVTEENLKELKDLLVDFKFYLLGIKRVSFSYAGLYSVNSSCLYTFHGQELNINVDENLNKPVLVGLNSDNDDNKKSNLILFERVFRCKFKDVPLVITDGRFDEDFFIYYKDLITD